MTSLSRTHIHSKEEWETLKDLRKDDSIIITKPDKGNGVVIVKKHDYLTKMKQLISDETKLEKLTENTTKSREQSLICYLRQLKRDHLIDDCTFQKVLPNGSTHMEFFMVPGWYFRNFWEGMCRWNTGTLSLYQS